MFDIFFNAEEPFEAIGKHLAEQILACQQVDYCVEYTCAAVVDSIKVPTLLIEPFIEQANDQLGSDCYNAWEYAVAMTLYAPIGKANGDPLRKTRDMGRAEKIRSYKQYMWGLKLFLHSNAFSQILDRFNRTSIFKDAIIDPDQAAKGKFVSSVIVGFTECYEMDMSWKLATENAT